MRPRPGKPSAPALTAALLAAAIAAPFVRGDEPAEPHGRARRPGLLSRFLPDAPPLARSRPPGGPAPSDPIPPPPPEERGPAAATPAPRLIPQPRVSRPVTEADPILTRVAIDRTTDGAPFCEFLQVYADGTVLDGQGVHRVDRETLRPLVDALQATDAYRLRGHCGGPPADFVEQVHLVVYDRSLGRLRANAFSHSGNTQGCDPAVRNLQTAIEAFQAKLGGPASAPAPAPDGVTAPAPADARPIPLTPAP